MYGAMRRSSIALALALLVGCGMTSLAHAGGRGVLVAEPVADPAVADVARGASLWLAQRFDAVGLGGERAPRGQAPNLTTALALARAAGAAYVVVPRLHVEHGTVRAQWLLFPAAKPELIAAPRASAPLAEVGDACQPAFAELLVTLGLDPDASRSAAPTLDELASTGRALAHLDAGRLLRAWREVQSKLSPTPLALRESIVALARRNGPMVAERSRVLAAAGDELGAWKLISPRLAKDATSRTALLAAAEVQFARGDLRGAVTRLSGLVDRDPGDFDAQLALARAHATAGRAAAAYESFERAATLEPSDPRPRIEQAKVATDDAARARLLLDAGERTARRLSPRRAQRLLDRAAELDPELDTHRWSAIGTLSLATGEHVEALAAWQRVISLEPENAEGWAGVGRARAMRGDPEARGALRRAVELAPTDAASLARLGELHLAEGDATGAVPWLEQAVEVAPSESGPRVVLARALRATGLPDDARATLEAAPAATVEILAEQATLARESGEIEAARVALTEAQRLDAWHPEVVGEARELAAIAGDDAELTRARLVAGLLTSSLAKEEEATNTSQALNLDALVLAFSNQVARASERRVAVLDIREREEKSTIWQRWLLPMTPDLPRLSAALDRAIALRFTREEVALPASPAFARTIDGLYDFEAPTSLDAATVAGVNEMLDVDALFVTRLVRTQNRISGNLACFENPGDFALESRLLIGSHVGVVSILTAVECVPGAMTEHATWNLQAIPTYAFCALLLIFPLLRGWGSLKVEIQRPPRTRGVLAIKVGAKPVDTAAEKRRQMRRETWLQRLRRALSRYERNVAGRETMLRFIPARHYYVTVRGKLYDAMGDDEIGFFLEEQKIKVSRRSTAELRFDFAPNEVAVMVAVQSDGAAVTGARVSLRDDPNSLRYLREGNVYFYLPIGEHVVCAGAGGRATERLVKVESLDHALKVQIDLGDEDQLMVSGAEDAVEPYLLGDFDAAARALDYAGETNRAHLMRGAHFQQRGEIEQAAAEFEAAGCYEEAAALRSSNQDHDGSAELYEEAGDFERAAEAYREAGAFADAARCYESVYDWESATECWEAAGDHDRVAGLHEKQGRYLDAATLTLSLGQLDRALDNLQQIERRDRHYGESCRVAAEVLFQKGSYEAAAQRQTESIEIAGGDSADVSLHERLAEILVHTTDKRGALAAYETVRRLDPRRVDVTQHIDSLREEITTLVPSSTGGDPNAVPSRYELLEEIGRGGMGVVFKARDTRLDRIVALKRLPDNLRDNAAAAKLFLREARSAASLNHNNIVTVYDADEENGTYHITMELLEGLPINVIQERRGQLSPADTARIGLQVCAGLAYAHERRIVHRDIKTANLFFTREKVVKIMDFGLAKTIEEVRKNSTVIGGTPYYMAPEQAAGGEIGPATDLYALGVTFHRLLTGTFPFTDGDLAYHHRHTPAPDPRQHRSDMSDGWARLILGLLEKDPAARPGTAAVVAQRLQELIGS